MNYLFSWFTQLRRRRPEWNIVGEIPGEFSRGIFTASPPPRARFSTLCVRAHFAERFVRKPWQVLPICQVLRVLKKEIGKDSLTIFAFTGLLWWYRFFFSGSFRAKFFARLRYDDVEIDMFRPWFIIWIVLLYTMDSSSEVDWLETFRNSYKGFVRNVYPETALHFCIFWRLFSVNFFTGLHLCFLVNVRDIGHRLPFTGIVNVWYVNRKLYPKYFRSPHRNKSLFYQKVQRIQSYISSVLKFYLILSKIHTIGLILDLIILIHHPWPVGILIIFTGRIPEGCHCLRRQCGSIGVIICAFTELRNRFWPNG